MSAALRSFVVSQIKMEAGGNPETKLIPYGVYLV